MFQFALFFIVTSLFVYSSKGQFQAANAGPPGWRMVDRFIGYRYELTGSNLFDESHVAEETQKRAHDLGCFGWIQRSPRNTLVGEMRCNTNRATIMKEWQQLGTGVAIISHMDIVDYEDTKIRLHFASFRVLPPERETCFLDPPHQCPEHRDTETTHFHTHASRQNSRTEIETEL